MEPFDKEDKMKQLFEEFRKTDKFYDRFKKDFIASFYLIIAEYYPEIKNLSKLNEILEIYSRQILSMTETVFDKDKSYPEHRKKEELEIMERLIWNNTIQGQNEYFIEECHKKAKELIVKYYEKVPDLSPFGFRLLEKNSKMYNVEFVANFYNGVLSREKVKS